MAPGLGRRVRPLAPLGRVLGQFHPSRTVLPLKKLKMFMALLGAVWNHYRRAASDVNIFNFFNYRIGLDGWNDQTGALGILGVAFGAVSGTVSFGAVLKKRRKFPARARRARGAFFFFFFKLAPLKAGRP